MVNNVTLTELLKARRALPAPAMRRAIREAAGASRSAVAREVGVTGEAVALWEAGKRTPSDRYIGRYLEVLSQLADFSSLSGGR